MVTIRQVPTPVADNPQQFWKERAVAVTTAWETLSEVDKREYLRSVDGDEPYVMGPDSLPQEGVPAGTVTKHCWTESRIFPGTSRDYWVYVPAQYDPDQETALMVFQDGETYLRPEAGINPVAVFDNLIHAGEMPPVIGLFVNPGTPGPGTPLYGGSGNRNHEYDSVNSDYASFLAEELIPHLQTEYNITNNPEGRGICGFSSGGICSFNAAWTRPDQFLKVVSHCGSFIDIHGGHNYPVWVRRQRTRPIRTFMQTGTKELNIALGDLQLASKEMASALKYRGYDVRLEVGEGGHTMMHAGHLFPETMRWLWRDYGTRTTGDR